MPSLLTDVYPDYGSVETPLWGEAQALDPSGVPVQERIRRTTPAWRCDLAWSRRRGATITTLRQFFRTLKSTGASCYFYTPDQHGYWSALAAGTGDGNTRAFTVPVRDLKSDSTVTVNSVAKVAGTDYELGVENRAVYSEDLSRAGTWAAGTGETIVRTGSQTDPLGGTTAWAVTGTGDGSTTKKLYQAIGTPAAGTRCKVELWISNNSIAGGSSEITVSCGQASQVVPLASGWVKVVLIVTANGTTPLEISFNVAAAGNATAFYLWHPLVCYGTSDVTSPDAWPYIPTHSAGVTAATLGRWKLAFYAAPTAGHAIVLNAVGRRLLLGYLVAAPGVTVSGYDNHGLAASFIGEESSGA